MDAADGPAGRAAGSSVDAEAGPRHREAIPDPIPRTGGGGTRLPGPRPCPPPTAGGVGKAGWALRGRGHEGRTLSPGAEGDLLSTPFLPKNTFLAKSPREERDPSPGRAAGGAAAAGHPGTRVGEEGSEGSALPGLFPLLSSVSLNGRRGRHFESEERRRRRRRQGEGRMGGRGPARPHRQAAGLGPQPPERSGEDREKGGDPRRLTRALHRRLRRASSVLHSHPPAGEGEREREGRKEGGRGGGRGGWRAGPGPGEGEGSGSSSAVPGREPRPGARGFSRSRPSAPLLLFFAP